MRMTFLKKTVRCLSAAEGYLELNLPQRAIRELDNIEEVGELAPYANFLRGRALRELDRYADAIDAFQVAASTMPAPLSRPVWEGLEDCFRHEGLGELADIAEMFADDSRENSDENLREISFDDFLAESALMSVEFDKACFERGSGVAADDFEDFNFECEEFDSSKQRPPLK